MPTLTVEARNTLASCNVTQAAYARKWFTDGKWHGDKCGCPDDRCIGYHHDADEDCQCIEAVLEDF